MISVGVFGANGFIGRHLIRSLLGGGLETICFGRQFPWDFNLEFGGAVETRVIDLHDDLETHRKLLGISHVVQLINSSNASIGNSKLTSDIESNLIPHIKFIKTCVETGVRSFTFLSSGGTVYGHPKIIPIPENHITEPLNSYGMTKLGTEQYLRMLARGGPMGFNILRVANPYGPGQLGVGGQGLIGTILQRHAHRQPISIFGDGLSVRDYIYIDDTVEAIVNAVRGEPLNDVVNIGSGVGRSILDVIAAVEAVLGASIPREFIENRTTDAPSNVLDPTKAKHLLNWEVTTPFESGVSRTVQWHMSRR